METSNPRTWSDLPLYLLRSIFNQLSFTYFHRAKIVSTDWYSSSKLTVPRKITSPWLILFPQEQLEFEHYTEEVYSLDDEALLLGLHITVPGIEPNSIYFTSHDSPDYRKQKTMPIDICVLKPGPSNTL
ncbi:putative F-box domain-containing protein [Arabidopsis thaliana]